MKKTVLTAVLLAMTLLSTGCAAEAVTGSVAEQAAQGSAGEAAGQVKAMQDAKERLEAKAYSARVVAEHESMMAGEEWKVTGGGWAPGTALNISLTSSDSIVIGAPVEAVADAEGHFDSTITIPEGTSTGTYTLIAAEQATPGGPQALVPGAKDAGPYAATVNVFAQ